MFLRWGGLTTTTTTQQGTQRSDLRYNGMYPNPDTDVQKIMHPHLQFTFTLSPFQFNSFYFASVSPVKHAHPPDLV